MNPKPLSMQGAFLKNAPGICVFFQDKALVLPLTAPPEPLKQEWLVSGRLDLRPETPMPVGAVDVKIVSRKLLKKQKVIALSGPVRKCGLAKDTGGFSWVNEDGSDMFPGERREGLVERPVFGWVEADLAAEGLKEVGKC